MNPINVSTIHRIKKSSAHSWILIIYLIFQSLPVLAVQVEAESVPSEKYFAVALNEINHAQRSITLHMYLITINQSRSQAQPYQLVNALIEAKNRGVQVEVVLDQNADTLKNSQAYETLQSHGVRVSYDVPYDYLHAKVLIVDDETMIVGSSNWTQGGLGKNVECNLLLRSKELTQEVLDGLKKVNKQNPEAFMGEAVRLPLEFMNKRELLGRMVTSGDERALDLYLYLLKAYKQGEEAVINLEYEDAALSLGMDRSFAQDYRRQINKALSKLETRYQLIDFESQYGQDARVRLLDITDTKRIG